MNADFEKKGRGALVFIPLSLIDESEVTFRTSWKAPSLSLQLSIAKSGLLNPLLLQEREGGFYRIVCGFRRFSILKEKKENQIMAFTAGKNESELSLFKVALYENVASREFDLKEKAMIFLRLKDYFKMEPKEIQETFGDLLSFGEQDPGLKRLEFLAKCSGKIRDLFAENFLSYDMLGFMEKCDEADRESLASLCQDFRLGKNKQKELLTLLDDILKLKQSSLNDFLKEESISRLLNNTKITPSQKAEKLFAFLNEVRYPSLMRAEEGFRKWVAGLKLPSGVRIKHGPYFETEGMECFFEFLGFKDFQAKIGKLGSEVSQERIDELKKIIQESVHDREASGE